jgi:hypothetical protein
MSGNTFFIPLAKTHRGVDIIDDVWDRLYESNEEKTNRFDEKLTHETMFILHANPLYADHINMVRIPNNIRDRCSIVTVGEKLGSESIYVMPINGDSSQVGPKYTSYNTIYNIVEGVKTSIGSVHAHPT